MICQLVDGYCERHKKEHKGIELQWALSATPKGEQYRKLWDNAVASGKGFRMVPKGGGCAKCKQNKANLSDGAHHRGPNLDGNATNLQPTPPIPEPISNGHTNEPTGDLREQSPPNPTN